MHTNYQNYIDGQFDTNPAEVLIDVINPADETLVARIPESSRAAVDAAVEAARRAQPAWARLPAIQRADYLRKIAAKIREHQARLAALITREQGKILPLAEVEVAFTADYLDYTAEWARRLEGEVLTSDRVGESIFLLRKPIGVVAGVLPWNFPFFLIARKLAPALLTGNTIVIKPSEETPANAYEFAKLVAGIDLPAGVFNLVGGRGATVGAQLSAHEHVNLVTFTGSVATGRRIMAAAANNLTRVNLELGGKAPAIVLADADLDLAAKAIWDSRIINTGQVCNCTERVYVERGIADAFSEKIIARMAATRYGDPSREAGLDMGPLINRAAVDRIDGIVRKAETQGAHTALGGHPAARTHGYHYEPTVLLNCRHDMDVMRHEVFGPVLPIQVVDSLDEAVALANDSEYGLTSSVFTRDLNAAMRAVHALAFGETYINRESFEAMQGFHAGRRHSGIGGADGKHGLYAFMETQVVYVQHG
jgi:lactaldehyde dehydrogenase / glycolaldehyde dehydrogenase